MLFQVDLQIQEASADEGAAHGVGRDVPQAPCGDREQDKDRDAQVRPEHVSASP